MKRDTFYFADGTIGNEDDGEKTLHRIDGPALILLTPCQICVANQVMINGPAKAWFLNNQLHRIDGPAIEEEQMPPRYFVMGLELSKEEFSMVARADRDELEELKRHAHKGIAVLASLLWQKK